MYCKECGKIIDDDSIYCTYCGTKQESDNIDNTNQDTQSSDYNQATLNVEEENSSSPEILESHPSQSNSDEIKNDNQPKNKDSENKAETPWTVNEEIVTEKIIENNKSEFDSRESKYSSSDEGSNHEENETRTKTSTEIKENLPNFNSPDNRFDKLRKHLASKEEKIVEVLGQNYLESLFSGVGMFKNIMILTDKRLYIKGKVYRGRNIMNLKSEMLDIIVPLKDVTGVELHFLSITGAKAIMIVSFILSFIGFSIALASNSNDEMMSNDLILLINYIGGPAGVLARWYSNKELQDFRKSLLKEMEKY